MPESLKRRKSGATPAATTRRSLMAAGVGVLITAYRSAQTPSAMGQSSQTTSAAREVEAASRKMVEAYVTNNHAQYFGAMVDDIAIWSGGRKDRMTKKAYMDLWIPNIERGGGIAKGDIQDLRVQVSPQGDAGVATFYMPVTTRVAQGSPNPPRDINYNITHVWFRNNGRWELVHYYWSTWNPPEAGSGQGRNRGGR